MTSPPLTTPLTARVAALECAACQASNRVDRQFCAGCGARLWEPCLACATTNAACEKHCGRCGANLGELVGEAQSAVAAALAEAAAFAERALHPQAVERLQALKIPDHGALGSYHQQVTDRIAAFRAEMLLCNRQRDDALIAARESLAAFDYEQAAITLEEVPEPYRTDELRQLLDDVRGRQITMLTLVAEIRRAMSGKQTEDLLPKVEELLRLRPDHEQARSLAARLRPMAQKRMLVERDNLLKSANPSLANHDYAAALELLTRIPDGMRTPKLAKLISQAQANADEVAWLKRDLVQAVVHDEHLLPIAERLLKLQPENTEALRCLDGLRNVKRAWPEPPERSMWGPPLETIRSFQRIDASALDNAAFQAAPERFCVAAGLALQGLQQGVLNVNLAPPERASVLGRLKARKKPATSAWGVDVGRAAIRAIRLTVQDDGRIVADAAICVEHVRMLNAPNVDAETTIHLSLDKLCEHAELRDAPLCVSVPAQKVLYRTITLPLVDEKKLAEVMKFEVRQQIPFPAEHIAWGYQNLATPETDLAHGRECEVALLAIKLEDAQSSVALFTDRDLRVELLTSDAAGLFNFVRYACEPSRDKQPPGQDFAAANSLLPIPSRQRITAILDVGTDSSNLILTNGQSLLIRSIPIGGNAVSRAIVKEFNLTFEQAEKLKRKLMAVRELHRLYGAVEPRFSDLIRELRRTIDGFRESHEGQVSRFLVAGGALSLHGALRCLWYGV